MSQSNTAPPGLWEKKTYVSAAVSALLAGSVAVTVCAFRGDVASMGPPASVRVSTGHTDPSTALRGGE